MSAQAQTALRRELQDFIEVIPIGRLEALRPLLADLAEPAFVIEDDLTEDELAIIAEGSRRYDTNPEDFLTVDEYKRSRGIG
jgi:hypothetical protein